MSDSLTRAQYCSLCYTTFTLAWNDAGNCFELRCPRAGCAGSETPTVFIPRAAFAALDEAKRAALLRLWPPDAEWPAWLLPDLMGSANGTDVRLAFAEMLQGGIIDRRDHRIPPRGEPGPEELLLPPILPIGCETVLGTPARFGPGFELWFRSLDASDLEPVEALDEATATLAVVDEPGRADEPDAGILDQPDVVLAEVFGEGQFIRWWDRPARDVVSDLVRLYPRPDDENHHEEESTR